METPCYVFSRKVMIDNYIQMQQNLCQCKLHYSTKANGNIEILTLLSQIKANFEICSLYEWNTLIELGTEPENIIFGLPIKQETLICELYQRGCRYFIFDTPTELEKLNRLAPKADKVLRIMVSDIVDGCIPFGMHPSQITKDIISHCSGLHFHITKNNDIDREMLILDRIEAVINKYSLSKIILNIGGSYYLESKSKYYDLLNYRLSSMKDAYKLRLYAEPGEAIIHTAGKVLTKILAIKDQGTHRDVYLDFGEPSGLRPRPDDVRLVNKDGKGKRSLYRFFDNTCRHQAHFSKFLANDLFINDCLEFSPYGAYTLCLSNDFHNFPRPFVYIEE